MKKKKIVMIIICAILLLLVVYYFNKRVTKLEIIYPGEEYYLVENYNSVGVNKKTKLIKLSFINCLNFYRAKQIKDTIEPKYVVILNDSKQIAFSDENCKNSYCYAYLSKVSNKQINSQDGYIITVSKTFINEIKKLYNQNKES